MNLNNMSMFKLVEASLFTDDDISLQDWNSVFTEMKEQSIAALPGEWLKAHLPEAKSWIKYCSVQQGQWIRVMHGQDQLVHLFEEYSIPCVIIKGASATMAYPHPMLRSMGDVDILVKREDHNRAAELMEANGFILTHDKNPLFHHYGYSKGKICFELHRRLAVIDNEDEKLLTLFEDGIEHREWAEIENYRFPVLPAHLNGLVLLFHINQHMRSGLGLRQIIDWMMYVNHLSTAQWEELRIMLRRLGLETLALAVTGMCQMYLGLPRIFSGCETIDPQVQDDLMNYILEKGNFGRKAGVDGKMAAFSLSVTENGGFFKRLQHGGLLQWKAAKKYPILRPVAWIYQSFRILGILIKSRKGRKDIQEQMEKGTEQRKLMEVLGLKGDITVTRKNCFFIIIFLGLQG